MQIVLKQNINTEKIRFLGEVAYRDENKFEVYKNIFKNTNSEYELKELLLKEGIKETAINEFCKTLRKQKIIDNEGAISKEPLIGEYGEYFLTFIFDGNIRDLPYNFLPIRMDRSIQEEHTTNTSFHISPKEFLSSLNKSKDLVAEKPVCSVFKIDSPTLIREAHDEENMAINIDVNNDEWNLQISDNSFRIPREKQLAYHQLFNEELIEENSNYYLKLPLEKAKDKSKYKNALLDFNTSFREQIDTDWGKFDAEYKNVNVLPQENEVNLWYNEIFNTTLKVEGYLSQEDLKFKWDEILRDKEYLQRDEYKKKIKPFDYEKLIERYLPKQEEYWLLQAATDLNPYSQPLTKTKRNIDSGSISIPKTDNGQIKDDILDKWIELYSAKRITIIDPYANNYYSLRALGELFSQMDSTPEEIVIVSQRDEKYYEEKQRKYIDYFKEKYNVKFDLHGKKEIPHDRYWFIDEKIFTVGVSPNEIWIRKDHIEIKQQININRIEPENLPAEIVKWSH